SFSTAGCLAWLHKRLRKIICEAHHHFAYCKHFSPTPSSSIPDFDILCKRLSSQSSGISAFCEAACLEFPPLPASQHLWSPQRTNNDFAADLLFQRAYRNWRTNQNSHALIPPRASPRNALKSVNVGSSPRKPA